LIGEIGDATSRGGLEAALPAVDVDYKSKGELIKRLGLGVQ
jgi:hypothetical protein